MARALIVGCGCAARTAGVALLERGWAVRGTSRSEPNLSAIEAAGIEAQAADPDRVGTVVELLADVTVVIWPLGCAGGGSDAVAAVHGPRLERFLEKLVDTPVRGFVYEAAGRAPAELLEGGRALAEEAGRRWRIPIGVVGTPRDPVERWAAAVADAADRLIGRDAEPRPAPADSR